MDGGRKGHRYEPGSYGVGRGFVAALAARVNEGPDAGEIAFMLVRASGPVEREEEAADRALRDFCAARAESERAGSAIVIADHLRGLGYKLQEDFVLAPMRDGEKTTAVLELD